VRLIRRLRETGWPGGLLVLLLLVVAGVSNCGR